MPDIDRQLCYRIEDLFFAADYLSGVAGELLKEIDDPEVKAVLHRSRVNFSATALALENIVKKELGNEQD